MLGHEFYWEFMLLFYFNLVDLFYHQANWQLNCEFTIKLNKLSIMKNLDILSLSRSIHIWNLLIMKLTIDWSKKLYHFLSVDVILSFQKYNDDEINAGIGIFLWNYLENFIKHLMGTYIFNIIFMILSK